MKTYIKVTLSILAVIIAIVLIFQIAFFMLPRVSRGCLDNIGKEYCMNNSFDDYTPYHEFRHSFSCINNSNQRTGKVYQEFYILDEEYENCKIKDAFTRTKRDAYRDK